MARRGTKNARAASDRSSRTLAPTYAHRQLAERLLRPTIKICGINDVSGLDAAIHAGADMVGFVFCERSPRHLSLMQAQALASRAGSTARRVALTVDADDVTLEKIIAAVRPDILQLHGNETAARVHHIRCRFGLQVMRSISIGSEADIGQANLFDPVADLLLFDALAPAAARHPGGNGKTFNWSLLQKLSIRKPWLLAGGLNVGNVASALAVSGARGIDVSSGVERAPGLKDAELIFAFVEAARAQQEASI